jgi:hypothetical protein
VLVALAGAVLGGCGWTIQPTPDPSGRTLLSVSCPGSDECIAAGFLPTAERWNGSTWQLLPSPVQPADANPGSSSLRAVSCQSTQTCIAVGGYVRSRAPLPLAERWNGSSWSLLQIPLPAADASGFLNGVSCTSINACTAVGYYQIDGNLPFGLIERWNGSSWSIQANPSGVTNHALDGVSCTSATECLAVGSTVASGEIAFSERWNGSSWQALSTPTPSPSRGSPLMDVSCTTASACTAVGRSLDAALAPSALVERWDGNSWTLQQTPDATGKRLFGVSCPATNTCTAVGDSGVGDIDLSETVVLSERWNGREWSVQPTPRPPDNSFSFFRGVSCASAYACEAVGASLDTPGVDTALAEGFSLP